MKSLYFDIKKNTIEESLFFQTSIKIKYAITGERSRPASKADSTRTPTETQQKGGSRTGTPQQAQERSSSKAGSYKTAGSREGTPREQTQPRPESRGSSGHPPLQAPTPSAVTLVNDGAKIPDAPPPPVPGGMSHIPPSSEERTSSSALVLSI